METGELQSCKIGSRNLVTRTSIDELIDTSSSA
ncbi:hypothetical protein [Parasphingopyxis sp. CP4]